MASAPLLAPLNFRRLHRAAHATLAPPPERHAEFDALFQRYFHRRRERRRSEQPAGARCAGERRLGRGQAMAEVRKLNESGQSATQSEALGLRRLRGHERNARCGVALREAAAAPAPAPGAHAARARLDLRRSLSALVANDGDLVALARSGRKSVPRRIVLLIDISGSMKASTDAYLDLAYELTREFRDTESFRLRHAIDASHPGLAQRRARRRPSHGPPISSPIGMAAPGLAQRSRPFWPIRALPVLPMARIVVVISDGLERGDHCRMAEAVRRLDRRARHLLWLSPLAGDPRYRPETAAIKAILPIVGQHRRWQFGGSVVDVLLKGLP